MARPIPRAWPLGWQSSTVDMNNTPLASPCVSQPFDLHHGSRLHHFWEHYQHTGIQRKWLHKWGDSIRPVSCWECSTVGSVDKWGLLLSLSATLEIFITTTYHPLINYTPAMGSQLIIYMPLISISPIDFCHSFEMDILEGIFSRSVSWHLAKHHGEPIQADNSDFSLEKARPR